MIEYIFMAVSIISITFIIGYRLGNTKGFKEGSEFSRNLYDQHVDVLFEVFKKELSEDARFNKTNASSDRGDKQAP